MTGKNTRRYITLAAMWAVSGMLITGVKHDYTTCPDNTVLPQGRTALVNIESEIKEYKEYKEALELERARIMADHLKNGQVKDIDEGSSLLLRNEADTNAEILDYLYNGMTFVILSNTLDRQWHKVSFKGNEGYVTAKYVEQYDETPPYELYVEPVKVKPKIQEESRPSRGVTETQYEPQGQSIKVELTGYCNCYYCTQNGNGLTASGAYAHIGTVAAPQGFNFGTQFYIQELTGMKSDGIFTVEDRGGAIVQKADGTYVIDVWFPSHQQALNFGRVKTYIKKIN